MRPFRTITVAAMTLPLVAAAASAELTIFNNGSPYFEWRIDNGADFEPVDFLDPTQDSSQSGAESPLGIRYRNNSPETSFSLGYQSLSADAIRFAGEEPVSFYDPDSNYYDDLIFAQLFSVGDLVGPGADFNAGPAYLHGYFFGGQEQFIGGATTPPAGPVFVGMELTIEGQVHYGWIQLQAINSSAEGVFFIRFEALSWAYETQAGVAAAVVPAPGVVSLIGCAGAALLRRRR